MLFRDIGKRLLMKLSDKSLEIFLKKRFNTKVGKGVRNEPQKHSRRQALWARKDASNQLENGKASGNCRLEERLMPNGYKTMKALTKKPMTKMEQSNQNNKSKRHQKFESVSNTWSLHAGMPMGRDGDWQNGWYIQCTASRYHETNRSSFYVLKVYLFLQHVEK